MQKVVSLGVAQIDKCCGICVLLLCDTRHQWHFLYEFDHHQTLHLASVSLSISCWAYQELTQCIGLDLMKRLGLGDRVEVVVVSKSGERREVNIKMHDVTARQRAQILV